MARHLLIAVHLHADGMGTARYHGMHQGAPEWPPAPARLFQALVSGVAVGRRLPEDAMAALRWLEDLPPPVIAAPLRRVGQAVSVYVPNNDADALADPTELNAIRTAKHIEPSLFDGTQPLLYAWELSEAEGHEYALIDAAQSVYQFGRGVDMAWAHADVLSDDELDSVLQRYPGRVHHPSRHAATPRRLACPVAGSLQSLIERHGATRLRTDGSGKRARILFSNPPKPRFVAVGYAVRRHLMLFELQDRSTNRPWPWPLHIAGALVEQVRDAAAGRLRSAVPESTETVERCLIGRTADGNGAVPPSQRVKLIPLPSIGSAHVDPSIRRMLVEVPGGCPIAAYDLDWAFSGLQRVDEQTGELGPWLLVRASETSMQSHYVTAARHWISVTPVALPVSTARRRIDPFQRRGEAKAAAERRTEEDRAVAAVHQALRHAGVTAAAVQVRVQREPFVGRGRRAEDHAAGTRFSKERLWHVAIGFDRPVDGPLVIGDGRFVGLGILAPAGPASGFRGDPAAWSGEVSDGVFVLQTAVGGDPPGEPELLARALRRAVMSRVGDAAGAELSTYFSGHDAGRDTPDTGLRRHLSYQWDTSRARWLVLAPHRLEHRSPSDRERKQLALLDQALEGMSELRAGPAGRFAVQRVLPAAADPVLCAASEWESVTPYVVTRHRRVGSASDALVADVLAECRRCRLPTPDVSVLRIDSRSGCALQGRLLLRFSTVVNGPLALGRSALLGGGLFAARKQ